MSARSFTPSCKTIRSLYEKAAHGYESAIVVLIVTVEIVAIVVITIVVVVVTVRVVVIVIISVHAISAT